MTTRLDEQPGQVIDTAARASDVLSALATLHSLTFATADEDVDACLSLVMRTLGVRSAFVAELSHGVMHVLHSHDQGGCQIPRGGIVPQPDTFCQYVRATRAPVIIADAANDPRVANVATRADFNIGSYLGVPILLSDGALWGSLCALDPDPHVFTPIDVQLLQVVAARIGACVERAQLRQMLVRSQRETSEDLSATLAALDDQLLVLQVVTHDLREPLNSMYTAVHLLELALPEPRSSDAELAFQLLHASTRYMHRLVNDLVDATNIDAPGFTVINDTVNPRDLIASIHAAMEPEAEKSGLILTLEQGNQLPTIISDPDRVRQILVNLITNALHYTETGSVRLSLHACADGIEFLVQDTGPGIAVDDQTRIWERHTRVSPTTKGFGLGLYVARQLVQALGGAIEVWSTPGVGSTFCVRLPQHSPIPHVAAWEQARSV